MTAAQLEEKLSAAQQRFDQYKQDEEQLAHRFKDLTEGVLAQRSKTLREANQDSIGNLVKPLKEEIKEFKAQLASTEKEALKNRGSLAQQINVLQESTTQLGLEAHQLAVALKGESKTQGNWGELVLERVLELSGLEEGREYEREVVTTDAKGRAKRPDVIIKLPGDRQVVIDAKVSLTAYEEYCSVEDEEERQGAMNAHIASIRSQVKELSKKEYQHLESIHTLDFVLMFMPVEAAFSEALRADRKIFSYALEKNVVIVTPSTLLATLRTIEAIWRREFQNRNVVEIARQAGGLHDKFVGVIEALEELGDAIEKIRVAYKLTRTRLYVGKDNLIRKVDRLRELGAKTSKTLPEGSWEE